MRGSGKKQLNIYKERCTNCGQTFASKSAYVNHEKFCESERVKSERLKSKRKNSIFKSSKIDFLKSNNIVT